MRVRIGVELSPARPRVGRLLLDVVASLDGAASALDETRATRVRDMAAWLAHLYELWNDAAQSADLEGRREHWRMRAVESDRR